MNLSFVEVNEFLACIYLAIIFLILIDLKYSLKVTIITMGTFVLVAFFAYLKLLSMGINKGQCLVIALTIPSIILCFFLSKNKDSRFVFTFCSVDIMGIIIITISRSVAILFNDNNFIIILLTNIGFLYLLCVSCKIQKQYTHIQRTLGDGWRSFAAVSLLFYIMMYLILFYPVPIIERREYVPIVISFSIIVIFVYIVIYQTLIKSLLIHFEKKDKELLEMKIALQNSQLEIKEMYYNMAYTDALTGLKNRAAFEEKKKELSTNIENFQMLSCLSIDMNNLKETNDLYGHSKGDELIIAFSEILKNSFDDLQNIYRIGGDEFILFFIRISYEEIEKQILNLKRGIIQNNNKNDIQISFAMGLAFLNEEYIQDVNSLIVCADNRMYENKINMKKE